MCRLMFCYLKTVLNRRRNSSLKILEHQFKNRYWCTPFWDDLCFPISINLPRSFTALQLPQRRLWQTWRNPQELHVTGEMSRLHSVPSSPSILPFASTETRFTSTLPVLQTLRGPNAGLHTRFRKLYLYACVAVAKFANVCQNVAKYLELHIIISHIVGCIGTDSCRYICVQRGLPNVAKGSCVLVTSMEIHCYWTLSEEQLKKIQSNKMLSTLTKSRNYNRTPSMTAPL